MKILALDSSGLVASVAVLEDAVLLGEYSINYKKTHSQTLLPMLEEIRDMIELDMSTVDAIAVAAGPGSFTGLRIGSATAKGLGLALNKPIVAIPTLEGLAYNLYGSEQIICPIMDARRGQVYTGLYAFKRIGEEHNESDYEMNTIVDQCAVDIHEIIEKINQLGRETIFLGDGVPVFSETIAETIKVPYSYAPAHQNRQRAASVGALAEIYMRSGKIQTAVEHVPEYLRMSQAERERMENGQ